MLKLRRHKQRERVVLVNEDGERIRPWMVRAGTVILRTSYDHETRTVVATIGPPTAYL